MTGMLVEFEFRGDICVIHLQGRFATGQDSLYLHTKAEELKNSGYVRILVDFGGVDYVDSTGIGFLIGIYTSVTRSPNGQFALANANRRVREVLEPVSYTHLDVYKRQAPHRRSRTGSRQRGLHGRPCRQSPCQSGLRALQHGSGRSRDESFGHRSRRGLRARPWIAPGRFTHRIGAREMCIRDSIYIVLHLALFLAFVILWFYLLFKTYNGEKIVLPLVGPFADKQAGV